MTIRHVLVNAADLTYVQCLFKSLYVTMKFEVLNTMNSLMACDTVLCGRQNPMPRTQLCTVTLQIKAAISSETLTRGVDTIVKICFMPHRKHTWSQLHKRNGPGTSVLLSHPCHVSAATLFTLCIHECQKFYDHGRERKQKIKFKNNKQQGTTGEEPGRSKLSILTSHSSNCAYQCCNRILLFLRHNVPSRSVWQVFVLFPMLWFGSF